MSLDISIVQTLCIYAALGVVCVVCVVCVVLWVKLRRVQSELRECREELKLQGQESERSESDERNESEQKNEVSDGGDGGEKNEVSDGGDGGEKSERSERSEKSEKNEKEERGEKSKEREQSERVKRQEEHSDIEVHIDHREQISVGAEIFELYADGMMTASDRIFLSRLTGYIEKNIDSSELVVNRLCDFMGVTQLVLNKKLKSLVGMTAINFIRTVRLRRAAQLLRTARYTVSDVTYDVGFSDLRYFRECFKREFGVLPQEYKEQMVEGDVVVDDDDVLRHQIGQSREDE